MILERNINYKYLGELDVINISNKIYSNNLDWEDYKFRQERYKDHSETRTIPIIWSENFKEFKTWEPYYSIFREDLGLVEKFINSHLCSTGKMMSAILINLPAGKSIGRHRDSNPVGNRFNRCHRIHIPVITNNECFFEIDDELKVMKEGEAWEINNVRKLHSVYNNGETDRIHLLIDWDPI
jgi:hypothetical protein